MSAAPFHITLRHINGLKVEIAEGPDGLTTTVNNGRQAWAGTRPDIEAALALAARIIEDKTFTVALPPAVEMESGA